MKLYEVHLFGSTTRPILLKLKCLKLHNIHAHIYMIVTSSCHLERA